jgi:hypothetical protein
MDEVSWVLTTTRTAAVPKLAGEKINEMASFLDSRVSQQMPLTG